MKENCKKIKDPRRTEKGHILHKLGEMLIIAVCSRISMGEDYDDMEEFGIEREKWLKEELGLELKHGIPSGKTFERIFEVLKPQELSKCLIESIEITREKRTVDAIDGKTICGSGNSEHDAYHVLSVFVAENQLTIGELVCEKKKSEKNMIPKVLDLVEVEGDIVTILNEVQYRRGRVLQTDSRKNRGRKESGLYNRAQEESAEAIRINRRAFYEYANIRKQRIYRRKEWRTLGKARIYSRNRPELA
jgi:hypothetical protein